PYGRRILSIAWANAITDSMPLDFKKQIDSSVGTVVACIRGDRLPNASVGKSPTAELRVAGQS
ncbi:MAG: hypothetical protein ACKVJN_13770, partial [Woeseiales bacterium]